MKMVFLDCEFTGEHAFTTLISVGLVTLEGEELYITLNDYNKSQVTDWVRDNVLDKIDRKKGVSRHQCCKEISNFLETYSGGDPVSLVSAGKLMDVILVFQLWHTLYPEREFFHFGECLPDYLNHRAHFDLDTIFYANGINPNICREDYISEVNNELKHDAIYDARVVRLCYLKLAENKIIGRGKIQLQ